MNLYRSYIDDRVRGGVTAQRKDWSSYGYVPVTWAEATPAADLGGGQPTGRAGPVPGQADVGGEAAGQPELGIAGDE